MVCLFIYDLYLFHLIVLLNSVCNCSNNLLSFLVDKVTSGTYKFVSVIYGAPVGFSIPATAALVLGLASLFVWFVNTQFSNQVKVKYTSQLINGVAFSRNGLNILMAQQFQHFLFLHCHYLFYNQKILNLIWNNLYFLLHHYLIHLFNNFISFLMSLNNFCCIQSNYTLALQYLNLLHYQ